MNVRVVVVDQILKKAIRMTKQDVLIQFFQEEVEKLLNDFFKVSIADIKGSVEKLIFHMELKRAAFVILEELYSNLPRK